MNVVLVFCYRSHPVWGREHRRGGTKSSEFDRTGGWFPSILYRSVFRLLLALVCWGTKVVTGEKIPWGRIWTAFARRVVMFFSERWLCPAAAVEAEGDCMSLPLEEYVCLLMVVCWMSAC